MGEHDEDRSYEDVPGTSDAADVSPHRRVVLVAVVISLVVLLLGAAAATVLLVGSSDGHPAEWDPRVEEMVAFVEAERARDFTHPVHIEFLSEDEYSERILEGSEGASEEETDEWSDLAGATARALGLHEGPLDAEQASEDLATGGTEAFYSFEDQRIFVRGEELDPYTKTVVVHELVHALQDQVIGLADLAGDEESDGVSAKYALSEADASDVELAWFADRPVSEQDEIQKAAEESETESRRELEEAEVPTSWQAGFSLPYAFGPAFVMSVIAEDGVEGLWALYETLDATLPVIDLTADRGMERVEVDTPPEPDGAETLDESDVGAFGWVVPLAEYNDPTTAREALSGWRGDASRTWRKDDRVCIDSVAVFADDEAAALFVSAAETWLAYLPAASEAEVARVGQEITLHTCDPGPEAEIPLTGEAITTIERRSTINMFAAQLSFELGMPLDHALCLGSEVSDAYGSEALFDPEFGMDLQTQEDLARIEVSCQRATG